MSYLQDKQKKIKIWRIRIVIIIILILSFLFNSQIKSFSAPYLQNFYSLGHTLFTSSSSIFHEIGIYFSSKHQLDQKIHSLELELEQNKYLTAQIELLKRQNSEYERDLSFFEEGSIRQKISFISFTSQYGTRLANITDSGETKYVTKFVLGPHGGVIGEVVDISDNTVLVSLISEQKSKIFPVIFGESEVQYDAVAQKNNLLIAKVSQFEQINIDTTVFLVTEKGNLVLGRVVRIDTNPQDTYSAVYISLLDDSRSINHGYLEVSTSQE